MIQVKIHCPSPNQMVADVIRTDTNAACAVVGIKSNGRSAGVGASGSPLYRLNSEQLEILDTIIKATHKLVHELHGQTFEV